MTYEEKRLYDAVTKYLTAQKKEAADTKNIHVSLALAVMQRRLVSSIYAIRNTLQKRWLALQGLADELEKNPSLWKQRIKLDDVEVNNIDDLDDLDDDERDAFDRILSDPKKLRMFTNAKNPAEIKAEAAQVKDLYKMADDLYVRQQEEQKYLELKKLLTSQGVIEGEKLVIFTEHKDTLLYLEERLSNSGYNIATIHGGMSVDERRASQCRFMGKDAQILICTDAAGEGINLQFCRLLINWDIPWNPNRLEQRMGRIHRYGQKSDVMVFNMVAANTREGQVLKKLLSKLDIIREQLGDDRVYDVIQDVLKGVDLDAIIASVLNGQQSDLDRFIDKSDSELTALFRKSIEEQGNAIAHTSVDYHDARRLKDDSDEQRLQPIYIRQFFERAFAYLGGEYDELDSDIIRLKSIPDPVAKCLKETHKIFANDMNNMLFFFDKHKYLDYQNSNPFYSRAHYINPGNALFDSLVDSVRDAFRHEMRKGTVLISPEDNKPYFAFFVKNCILDNRPTPTGDSNVVNELLSLVCQNESGSFYQTSPAKLLDLCPPSEFAKEVTPPDPALQDEVMQWAYENQTEPLLIATEERVRTDTASRLEYLKTAFTQVILDLSEEINDLQGQLLFKAEEKSEKLHQKLANRETQITELKKRRQERLAQMEREVEVSAVEPEILGCAYVVPLAKMEYRQAFGMTRDDEVEHIAMKVAIEYETKNERTPIDVSDDNVGYDIRSISPDGAKRYIEVKGRAQTDGVMLSENEVNRLNQLGDRAWLYIVTNCATEPSLAIIQNPVQRMNFERKVKGVQFYLPLEEWQRNKN